MSKDFVLFERRDAIVTLTLNAPEARNALTSQAQWDAVVAACERVQADPTVKVVILTGAGSAFCAGGNVKDFRDKRGLAAGGGMDIRDNYRRGIQRIPLALQQVEIPIIAAVNGPAMGAGFDLANMADIRLASSTATFGETFLNLGLIPGDGGAWFLQRLIGYQQAFAFTLSGRIIDAAEAKAMGIVLEVVEPAQLMTRARELAAGFARQPPKAVRLTKRLMKMAQRMELKDFLDLSACFQGQCHQEPEHLETVRRLLKL